MSKQKHWHVASAATKEAVVAATGGPEKRKGGKKGRVQTRPPSPSPGPSLRTLQRWRKEYREQGHALEPLPKGHAPHSFSEGEKRVVGGMVLQRFANHQITSVSRLQSFALGAWNQHMADGMASQLMHELTLPSRAVEDKELKYWNPNMVSECLSFLKGIHKVAGGPIPVDHLTAVDVCYWRNSGHIVRSYGPAGQYDSILPYRVPHPIPRGLSAGALFRLRPMSIYYTRVLLLMALHYH